MSKPLSATEALAKIYTAFLALPKPEKRGKKLQKRIQRTARIARSSKPVKKRSRNRANVERDDVVWRLEVKRRAGWCCERCFANSLSEPLDAHHARGKKSHPSLRHVIENGVALDRGCHQWAHREPWEFRAWFRRVRSADYELVYRTEAA